MLMSPVEHEGEPRTPDLQASAPVESEFFVQLQELRDRIRLWEAENGDSGTRNPPS